LLSSLAAGGDQLVAEEALTLGAQLIVPLPMQREVYLVDFDPVARRKFDAISRHGMVWQLPLMPGNNLANIIEPGAARDRQYAQAGVYIASHSHILLALWDGRASHLTGGTSQIIRFHLHGSLPGVIERRRGVHPRFDDGDESLIYHIPCSRDVGHEVQAPLPPLQALVPRWIDAQATHAGASGMPSEFRLMIRRIAELNADLTRYQSAIAASRQAEPDMRRIRRRDEPMDVLFHGADWLALHFQLRVKLALRLMHGLAAMMGIALVCYSDLPGNQSLHSAMIYLFLLLFASGIVLENLIRRRDWHRKYVDYRALAEGLRVQRYWRLAGIAAANSSAFAHDNFLQKQDIELGWIRNVMRAASLSWLDVEAGAIVPLDAVVKSWIGNPGEGGQLDYYTRNSAERQRISRQTQTMARTCLWAGISISIILALLHSQLDGTTAGVLVVLMGILAILAAARESYAYRKADKELVKQYRFMLHIFSNARAAIDAEPEQVGRREILRELGETALAEHAEWALMQRERPLEHGSP
ncbi:MAG TPA: hypothetical protein VFN09_00475, partial [Rhodanobacteraceae bacterium]|nr:hypothetical protein [Rhodanobacteraceae bacterium]